ncbi:hypothetical protein E4U91_37365 [Streptomyces lasalocidi]|uniref:Uncharacterized protein n=1 Tax=Streptomyces lasalocidi TaxID=324833 RepID=A0A4U5W4G3_STRLS|nr:hypothetical protein E4U91_37365 [Streptomyces lasalocidi]
MTGRRRLPTDRRACLARKPRGRPPLHDSTAATGAGAERHSQGAITLAASRWLTSQPPSAARRVIAYSMRSGSNTVLEVANLDPHHTQEATVYTRKATVS